MYDITFSVTICTRIKYMRFLMQSLCSYVSKAKPFRDRLIIPAVEYPQPEVSKMTMDVSLPVAELPQSPIPELVPENQMNLLMSRRRHQPLQGKHLPSLARYLRLSHSHFQSLRSSHYGIFLITPRGKQK